MNLQLYLFLCRAGSRVLLRRLCLARVRLGGRLESRAQIRRRRRAGSRPACPVEIRLVSLVQYHLCPESCTQWHTIDWSKRTAFLRPQQRSFGGTE